MNKGLKSAGWLLIAIALMQSAAVALAAEPAGHTPAAASALEGALD
ncbi:MAG: hypothetical protein AAGD86_00235 [Pseudomonadota bacterium]